MDDTLTDEPFNNDIIETDLNDLCRICGSTSDSPLIAIYEENGLSEELASKIMQYLPIKVSEEDILPVKACVNCTNSILTWHLLYECCVDADRRFKSMLSEEQLIERPQSAVEPDEPMFQKAGEDIYGEADDEGAEQAIDLHREMDDNLMLKTQFGPEDEQYLDDESNLQSDENKTEIDEQNPVKLSTSFENSSDCIDSPAASEFSNAELLECVKAIDCIIPNISSNLQSKSPSKSSNSLIFTCPVCQISYSNKKEFVSHLLDVHKSNHELLVLLGHKPTKIDKKTIREARTTVDHREMYKCRECNKLLSSSYCFKNHLRIHTNERPYTCLFCEKSFRIYTGIVRHIQTTHLQIKNFTCEICSNKFANLVNLKQHYRLHTDERSYVCDICGKSFRQKASLFLHNRTHQTTFRYKCTVCEKGFRAKTPMLLHMAIHTGEKSHKCDVCNKMFRLKTDLRNHKLLHSDNTPFQCQECSISFKQKRYLTRHIKSHHSNVSKP